MKTTIILRASAIVCAIITLAGCNRPRTIYLKSDELVETKSSVSAKTQETAPVKAELAKKPAINKIRLKNDLMYEMKLNGGHACTVSLPLGYFELDGETLECYAALAQNGLVDLTTEKITLTSGQTETWAKVALTSAGKRYLYRGNIVNKTKPLDKKKYASVLNPSQNLDEYGLPYAIKIQEDTLLSFLKTFYAAYVQDENSVSSFYDPRFAKSLTRLTKIESLSDPTSTIMVRPFTAGLKLNASQVDSISFYRVPRYKNCFLAKLPGKMDVTFTMNNNAKMITDLVLPGNEEETVGTANFSWTEEAVSFMEKNIADEKTDSAENAEKKDKAEEIWNAPGLIQIERFNDLAIKTAKENSVKYLERIVLYTKDIDRIYKIKINSKESKDPCRSYDFDATATVVYKKTNFSPFQFILQKYGLVTPVTEADYYEVERVNLSNYDDCKWNLGSTNSFSAPVERSIDLGSMSDYSKSYYDSYDEEDDEDEEEEYDGGLWDYYNSLYGGDEDWDL